MCDTAALKSGCGFKGYNFPHEDNMATDVTDETEISLLDKFINYPTIAYAQGALLILTMN